MARRAAKVVQRCRKLVVQLRVQIDTRARGRLGGRPRRMTPEQVKMASHLMQDPAIDVKEIVRTLGVSRSTLYRYVGPTGDLRGPGPAKN